MRDGKSNSRFLEDLRTVGRLRFALVVLILVVVSTLASFANPKVNTSWAYYSVTATTIEGIRTQLRSRGPRGVFGVTRWHVQWSGDCQVKLNIIYSIPRHDRRNAVPPDLLLRWDRMTVALRAHEQRHGAHALNAAQEIAGNGCQNGSAIVAKWREIDRQYDQQTGHGRTEGVVFP